MNENRLYTWGYFDYIFFSLIHFTLLIPMRVASMHAPLPDASSVLLSESAGYLVFRYNAGCLPT